jgi:hypothetical protein
MWWALRYQHADLPQQGLASSSQAVELRRPDQSTRHRQIGQDRIGQTAVCRQ